ncbi:putative C6 transcription factor [Coniochaeta sp. 2T2.1]|nr:putative C6 transcription factor [Coniochaeta sp. 2T2.1]
MPEPTVNQIEPRQRSPDSGPPPAVSVRKYNVKRSCIRCHERKVRCDKEAPCVACVRAEAQCRYPGPERAKRRSQFRKGVNKSSSVTTTAVQHAEAQHGHSSSSTHSQAAADSRTRGPNPPSGAAVIDQFSTTRRPAPSESEHSGGFLLKEGSSTRYVNEFTFSRVLEKQNELQSAIDENTPDDNLRSGSKRSTFGFDGLISDPSLEVDISSLLPTRWQATQLWQAYLNNVNGLVKLLHIPTVQPTVFAAINNPKDTAPDLNALLFSIYFAAVASLRWTEVQTILGQDRQAAMTAYERGIELSLHAKCFLDSPTILSLQALALYLMCYRNSNSGRTGWILNGLLIRAAVAVGLHRDGEKFNLSPLDTEIRRRLWWQILGSDGRAAEDHGLSAGPNGGFDGFCDTKLPTHIDDRDITPNTNAPVCNEQRWTELTHFLVASEMYQALQQINRLSAQSGDDKMAQLDAYLATVKTDMQRKYLQYCDPNIPNQKVSLLLGRLLLGKSEVFVRQQALRGLSPEEAATRADETTLALACDTLEVCFELKTDELLGNYQWLLSTFTEYHLLTYTLWHLCVRPQATAGTERAWTVVDKMFTLIEMQGPPPGAKWNVLRKLREKAVGVGKGVVHGVDVEVPPALMGGMGNANENGNGVPQQRDGMLQPQQMGYPDPNLLDAGGVGASPMFNDAMVWDLGYLVFPDWGGNPTGF